MTAAQVHLPDMSQLAGLARSRLPADRERLLDGLLDLGQTLGPGLAPRTRETLEKIFLKLVSEAESHIRARVARQIASADWPPPGLVTLISMDDIDIARPLIAASPQLADTDLIHLLTTATLEHQIAVARRPDLSPKVVDAVLMTREPVILKALTRNTRTALSVPQLRSLIETARSEACLHAPLSRHPQLSEELACQLYVWVGQSLRSSLTKRFSLDSAKLDQALADAVSATLADVSHHTPAPQQSRATAEDRLVEKLAASGQLRAGLLVRSLHDGRLGVFKAALCRLGHLSPVDLDIALSRDDPQSLALACAAAGIDRVIFPAMLGQIRSLNGGLPGGSPADLDRAMGAFGPFDRSVAARALRTSNGSI